MDDKTTSPLQSVIRIAICDDNDEDRIFIRRSVESCCANQSGYTCEIQMFSDPTVLLDCIEKKGGFDILLLDVYMPEKTGTRVAGILRKRNDHCEIIFITSSDDHAFEAYKVNAIHYLKKPVKQEDLCKSLDRALVQLERTQSGSFLIKTTAGICRLNASELVYTKSKAHYQQLHLTDGKTYEARMTVAELFETVSPADAFMRIGAAYTVSVRHIGSIDAKEITLKNGVKIPLPRNTYKKVRQEYLDLLFGKK